MLTAVFLQAEEASAIIYSAECKVYQNQEAKKVI
jgi:hypothetical protein